MEAVLIFQAEKDITEEILAERRMRCHVRWHDTTGRRCLRSYRAPSQIAVPVSDRRLDREETRSASTSLGTTGAVIPGGRTVPPKFVRKAKINRRFNERRYDRSGRTVTPGRDPTDLARYNRNDTSAVVPCDRTVPATTLSTPRSKMHLTEPVPAGKVT